MNPSAADYAMRAFIACLITLFVVACVNGPLILIYFLTH